jgi:hypothetical protein
MKNLFALLAVTLLANSAIANIGPANDYTIHQQYLSPRAVGMGNAFVAVADDPYALFYNPAGLAWLEHGNMNFGVGAMGDIDIPAFWGDLKEASDDQGNDVDEMTALLQANYGKHFSARAPTLGAFWVRPNWGIAIIPADLSLEIGINRNGLPAAGIVGTNDTTIAYGRGWNIKVGYGKLAVGATARAVYRLYSNKVVNAAELALKSDIFQEADAKEGLTVDADLGILYAFPKRDKGFFKKWFRPTLGAAVRNVADYGFTSNMHLLGEQTGTPERARRRFDVGAKFDLKDWWLWKARLAIDVRDMGHDNWTLEKGSHMGVEFLWKVAGWWKGGWRIGLNQAYPSLGFSGKLGIFQLDIATYGEQVRSSADKQQNRRYIAKASLDF